MSEQLTAEDVTRLYRKGRYDLIESARLDGRLATLLGQPVPDDAGTLTAPVAQLTDQDVHELAKQGKHAEIEQARKAGQLAELLGHDTI